MFHLRTELKTNSKQEKQVEKAAVKAQAGRGEEKNTAQKTQNTRIAHSESKREKAGGIVYQKKINAKAD